jgi:hypothetical protein
LALIAASAGLVQPGRTSAFGSVGGPSKFRFHRMTSRQLRVLGAVDRVVLLAGEVRLVPHLDGVNLLRVAGDEPGDVKTSTSGVFAHMFG